MPIKRALTLLMCWILLSACSLSREFLPFRRASPTPTSTSTYTRTALPPTTTSVFTPTSSPPPLTEITPAHVLEPGVEVPTPTTTPVPVNLPLANLTIYRPGPDSHVRSPIQVVGYGGPSFNERVNLRLLGEDGRVISEIRTYLLAYPGNAGRFSTQISFSTPLHAEAARLEVSTQDRRYGLLKDLATVDLVLLSSGYARIHPAIRGPEKLTILYPRDGAYIEGGTVHVEGAGWVEAQVPLTIEIVSRNGTILASQQVQLSTDAVNELGTFQVDIPYDIPSSQYVRIAVSEPAVDIPGLVHYSSIEVWLQR